MQSKWINRDFMMRMIDCKRCDQLYIFLSSLESPTMLQQQYPTVHTIEVLTPTVGYSSGVPSQDGHVILFSLVF